MVRIAVSLRSTGLSRRNLSPSSMSSRKRVVGVSTPCTFGIAFISAAEPANVMASAANGKADAVLKRMTPREGPTN